MKVLFIGLGGVGQRHLRNSIAVLDEVEIHAFRKRGLKSEVTDTLDKNDDEDIESKYSIVTHNSIDDGLSVNPSAVIIANPSSMHFGVLKSCLEKNIPCFVEKPMVTNSAGVDELLELANFGVKHSMVGFQLRYSPVVQKLKEIIEDGSLGKVLSCRAEVCEYMPGFHPYEDYRGLYCSKRNLGGGVVMTQIHELDLLIHLFGMPDSVYAIGGHLSELEIDVEDSVDILMRNKDMALSLRMDYLQKPRRRSGIIYGDKGWVEYDLVELSLKTSSGDYFNWKDFDRNKMFIDEISNFFNSIKNAKEPEISLNEGLKSVRLAESILKSLDQNKEIKVGNNG
jgi:predicted dehydrogenase